MISNPTITAIVPAYNVERYLAAAVDSLLQQDQPFHQIIIVDDGSTDGTGEVLEYYRKFPTVNIVRIENGGLGNARNVGVAHASGEFIYFFDSDDVLKNNFVSTMNATLCGRPDVDIVYFSGESFLDSEYKSDFLPAYRRGITAEFASGIDATGALLGRGTFFSSACLYVSRLSVWKKERLAFMSIVHEDEELITRLTCAAGVSICLDTVFFERRIRAQSIMTLAKSERNTTGYLHTISSLAKQCRQERSRLAPIEAHLVRRFYTLLQGYLTICKKIGTRPRYLLLIQSVRTLGRLPSVFQLYQMSIFSRIYGRISRLTRRLDRA